MSYEFYITPEQYKIAAQNGISASLLTERVRALAWDIKRATTTPPRRQVSWASWIEIAKKNGIRPDTFRSRVNRQGMTPEQAATTPAMPREEIVKAMAKIRRKYPKHYEDMAVDNGITRDAFRSRMKRGWGPKKAATVPMDMSRIRKGGVGE